MRCKTLPIAAALILASPFIAGCGDDEADDGAESPPPAATTVESTTPASGELTIRMTEFAFEPSEATVAAGKVKITAPNDGNVVHELVILKTDADPAKLPMDGDEVDESTAVGEIADVEPAATKTQSFKLEPGTYAMVCALPGHYEGGMYGSLTAE